MILLGFGVTLLSGSLVVSCGLWVPLYGKGYISIRKLISYVMGANLATFSDTLQTAQLAHNVAAMNLVTSETICLSVFSLIILFGGFSSYLQVIQKWTEYFTDSPKHLIQFLVLSVSIPLILFLL
jgi:Na+/phosphate symporter